MAVIKDSDMIEGVQLVEITAHGDQRGRFAEVFRKEWFPQRTWDDVQWSRSESRAGTLRGLHFHHRQIDYWHCAAGTMRVGLLDLRVDSPTRGAGQVVELNQQELGAIFIPIGVEHGFYAVTDVMLFYLVDNYYDGTDELGVAWDDEEAQLDWGVSGKLTLSERDRNNPRMRDIPTEQLPR